MEVWNSIVTLLTGLAWPGAAVAIAVLFRKEIRTLTGRVRSLKWKDLEADLTEASNTAVEIETQSDDPNEAEAARRFVKAREGSRGEPGVLIDLSWLAVIDALNEYRTAQSGQPSRMGPLTAAVDALEILAENRVIPSGWSSNARNLYKISSSPYDIVPPEAVIYSSMCQQLVADLLRATAKVRKDQP